MQLYCGGEYPRPAAGLSRRPWQLPGAIHATRSFHVRNGRPLTRPPRLELSEFHTYLINRVGSALVTRFSAEALNRKHLSIDMWRVLAALSNDGRLRQIDLAGMTSIEVSTVSRLVTRLAQMGLVIR